MNELDDFDGIGGDAIDQNIVWVHDGLARAGNPARTAHVRMVGQTLRESLDRRLEPPRGGGIMSREIFERGLEVFERLVEPDELQDAFRRRSALSIIACTRAIASSWGTGGFLLASDSSTLRLSHSL